jgi:DNA-binding transcriptional MerR regulator
MTIGEVATRAGLAPSAIRYYEKAGLLKAPARTSGQRRYGPAVLSQLVIVRFAQDTGFTLVEIKQLLHGFPQTIPASARWKKLAGAKIIELETAITKTRAMQLMLEGLMSCLCQKLEQCAQSLARYLNNPRTPAEARTVAKTSAQRPAEAASVELGRS